MASKRKNDKIGTLSHSAGTISLQPSLLTIGGQQFKTDLLSRLISTDVTLVANTRYQVYAVRSGGVISLKISTNENSSGPSGFTSWKLVGSFYADGLSVVGFGSFVTIEGVPRTSLKVNFLSTWTGSTTNPVAAAEKYLWSRKGAILSFEMTSMGSSTTGSGNYRWTLPFLPENSQMPLHHNLAGYAYLSGEGFAIDNSVGGALTTRVVCLPRWDLNNNLFILVGSAITNFVSAAEPFVAASGDSYSFSGEIPISTWSNTPISEL